VFDEPVVLSRVNWTGGNIHTADSGKFFQSAPSYGEVKSAGLVPRSSSPHTHLTLVRRQRGCW